MGRRVKIQSKMTAEELYRRYRRAKNAVEGIHWSILWQAKEGKTPQQIAEQLGYTARWIRAIIGRWNERGEEGIRDHRQDAAGSPMLLSQEEQEELRAALQHQHPQASVEPWAMDEHRIGLKPILRRVWAPKGATVKAQVAQRYEWMYVLAFVGSP
jgi:Winged helix-turn helix